MFETTVVESRVGHASRTRALTLPVSIGLHGAVIATALLANAWSLTMPGAAPPQFQSFVMPALPTIPVAIKPKPPAPEPPQTDTARTEAPTPAPAVDAPPTRIPEGIPNLTPGEATGPVTGPVKWDWDGTGTSTGSSGVGLEPVAIGPHVAGTGGVTKPITIKRLEPVYPPILVKAKLPGSATVECIVEADGTITSATVVSATHELFGEAAREAVLQWKFLPGRLNGDPVPTIFQLTVSFQVKR